MNQHFSSQLKKVGMCSYRVDYVGMLLMQYLNNTLVLMVMYLYL